MGSMERKIILGWVLTLAIVVFILVYWINEPQRMVASSDEIYNEQCAFCYGDDARE